MQKSFGGNYDRKLFAKLRKLRKAIADEENIPPYVVFNDATLIEMAEQMPLTPARCSASTALARASWSASVKSLWR
jgi:ATP-dependent DNA helicase RecQ